MRKNSCNKICVELNLISLSTNKALQLAALATEASEFKDWWWKVQLGKCYFR